MKARSAYSHATRLAATFLAKLNGADAAATAFGIDPRTVRSWMGTVEVPDDSWTAIRDVLLARGAEMAALGKTAGLPAILTGAGISDRNVRYGQLIARREARREDTATETLPQRRRKAWHLFEYPNSGTERVAVVEEDEHRLRKYMHCAIETTAESIRAELSRRAYAETTPREGEEPYRAEREGFGDLHMLELGIWVQLRKLVDVSEQDMSELAGMVMGAVPTDVPADLAVPTEAMTDDEYAAWLAKLRPLCIAKAQEWWPTYQEAQEKLREAVAQAAREDAEEREQQHTPVPEPTELSEPAPTPIRRASRAPEPAPMLIDVGSSDHDRGWQPYERRDNW